MKFSNMAAILSLLAGFVVCVATFISGMDLMKSLIWVLAAIIIFYILGSSLRALFNVILSDEDKSDKEVISEDEGSSEAEEASDTDNQ